MSAGCGVHRAAVATHDGAIVAEADALVSCQWSRALDDFGTAEIEVWPRGDCCQSIGAVRCWVHQLLIWRDDQFVWSGPVTAVQWSTTGVKIAAADVLGWLTRRVVHTDQSYDADLTTIAAGLIQDGFAPDDPGHEVEIISRAKVSGERRYFKDASIVFDDLQDLADTGLDFTAVGNKILLMGEGCETKQRVGTLTDADFPEGLTITDDGASTASRWIVHGGQQATEGERPPVIGTAEAHNRGPLIEQVVTEQSIRTEADAVRAARSRLAAGWPVPLFVDSSQERTLSPDAAIDVPSLVPGWCVDVYSTATCRPLATTLKIQGVKVKEGGTTSSTGSGSSTAASGGGGDAGESVSVQLAPPGGEDLGPGTTSTSSTGGISSGI